MPPVGSMLLERLLAAYHRGERLVLVFDYDGTLTPLVAHPSLARLDPALRDVLARLAATPRVTVGVVSGRGLDDLVGMVGLEGLSYGGSTGLELELAGERRIPAEALETRALLESLRAASASRLAAYPGAWVETKPFGFTVHYRQLVSSRIDPLRTEIADLLEPHAAGLHVLDGPLAIEVVPAIDRDKGTALRAIVDHGGGDPATVLYAGDAANDALALTAAAELGGVALGVGPEPPPVAEYRLSDPAALAELLAALAEALPTTGSPSIPIHEIVPAARFQLARKIQEARMVRNRKGWVGVDDPLWYQDAIIYQLHVKAFGDSSQDGIGDFRGLIQRLDYLQELGVDTLWLMPFYPSPLRDDGYDISDYQNVHPDYGTLADFRAFVREAHARGLKIVTELVINHTSDQHPWFQAARRAPPGSPERDFYVWNDDDQKFPETRIIFTDTETSNWAWDRVAQQYYWHRFFSHQPDLNHNNPAVVKAVSKVMRFWLDLGVDGLRLDAIPYLCVREGTHNENLPETHAVIRQMRAVVDRHYHGRLFLAEANQWPEDVRDYFGDGDECHMAYHFPLMPRMFMAIAQEDRYPIVEILEQTPDIPENCQWAIFLRNHDELTLEMVTDRERDYMYRTYAADPRMRVNVGIRRRLAPLLDNDSSKIKLMKSLLLSMPGTPIFYYGDEIGMGDNIYLGDRNGVRTPMQWSPDRNAGFSKADPQRLYLPPIMDPIYGYQAVNVEAQQREPASLLNWMKRMIAVRRTSQAFGRGRLEMLRPGNRKILAYVRTFADEIVLCVANLSRSAQPVELDLSQYKGMVPMEMLGQTAFPPISGLPYLLTLARYGFYWFRLSRTAPPTWHEDKLPGLELRILVLFHGWKSFFVDQVEPGRRALAESLHEKLVREVLPEFLPTQRWFAGKGGRIERVEFDKYDVWVEQIEWVLARIRVWLADRSEPQDYGLPLALAWEDDGDEQLRSLWPYALARVRARAKMGLLYDAFANEHFGQSLVKMVARNARIPLGSGWLRFSATRAFARLAGDNPELLPVQRLALDSSNTTLSIGDRILLKGYRRLQLGVNPELEMGRFLTEVADFPNIAPLAGGLEYEDEDGNVIALALLQGFVANQGDAWSYTQDYLKRFLDDCRQPGEGIRTAGENAHAPYLLFAATLGRRTGELHRVLAQATTDPAFGPEPITVADMAEWLDRIRKEVKTTFARLGQVRGQLPEPARSLAEQVLAAGIGVPHAGRYASLAMQILESRGAAAARAAQIEALTPRAMKTRYHGDYHLGQVLVAKDDVIIIDFEGEPSRSLAERRAKHSPLRDVVGMLRSFDYAAHAALLQATADGTCDRAALSPHLDEWERQSRAAFWEGYVAAAGDSPGYPTDPDHAKVLLELFTLEKACYELRYELDNRPDWVEIPLGGLRELLSLPT